MLVRIVLFFVASAAVVWLWNGIIPWVIGFPPVTYWQAAGLLLLTRILFGGLLSRRTVYPWTDEDVRRENSAAGNAPDKMAPEEEDESRLRNRVFLNEADDL